MLAVTGEGVALVDDRVRGHVGSWLMTKTPRSNGMRIAALASASLLTLGLAACSSDSGSSEATPAATSAATSAATDAATDAATQDASAALPDADYFLTSCTDPAGTVPVASDGPAGDEINGVSAILVGEGVPSIVTAANAEPATELGILDLAEGDGKVVEAGDTITFDYCGVGQQSHLQFDSSYSRGEPLTYALDGLITGWQQGIPGMKEGGVRLLVIPGELAYGENPPAGIGVNETLAFVVAVKSVDAPAAQ